MESPWQNLFSDLEILEDGDFFNQYRRKNSFDDEEMILREFAFSSDAELHNLSSEDTAGILNDRSTTGKPVVCNNVNFKESRSYGGNLKQLNCGLAGGEASSIKRKPRSSSKPTTANHNMAERKRRLELSQRLIALSAIIPGLNKIDKASILKEAIAYVKQLQARVNELEEQCANKIIVEPLSPSINNNDFDDCHDLNTKVEAKLMEKEVLIRIHCQKNYGILLKTLSHMKSLHLFIVSYSVLPFGKFSLAVTINAQMGDKCDIAAKDLVKSLRRTLLESPDKQQ